MQTSLAAGSALALFVLGSLAAAPSAQAGGNRITNYEITGFSKNANIFTNLNKQFPNTGASTPNALFLFDPATYTSANAVSGANQTTNGVKFLITSDTNGADFAQISTSLTIASDVSGVTSVTTLTNSYHDAQETIMFTGSGGATETFSNVQLHDFNAQGGPINNSFTVNGSATPNLFDQTAFQVNDQGAGGTGNSGTGDFSTYGINEQTFDLTPAFAGQTLQSITITNDGGGTPILLGVTAITAAPVPEASSVVSLGLLLTLGLGGLIVARRKQTA